MKFSSVLLSVLMAGGLVSATGTPEARQSPNKIAIIYSEKDYQGLNYTLFDNRLDDCVDFPGGPLIVSSAQLFRGAVCDLYTKQDCASDSFVRSIVKNATDIGMIEPSSINCTTGFA